jgi:hypothetical protein
MKSPFALVTEKFGDKKKLVEAVEKFTGEELWVAKINTNKGLAHVSNAKLLRLHATFSAVKEKFGTRFKLVDAQEDSARFQCRILLDDERKFLLARLAPTREEIDVDRFAFELRERELRAVQRFEIDQRRRFSDSQLHVG